MHRLSSVKQACYSLGFLVAAVSLLACLPAPPALTQTTASNVVVTNSTTQPVPVKFDAAGNLVRLAPTGNTVKLDATTNTVKATQSGTWNVGLTAAGNLVRVGNAKTSPVPTYDAREGQTPFQITLSGYGSGFTVPAGKRLIIEHVGYLGDVSGGGTMYTAQLATRIGGVVVYHYLDFHDVPVPSGFSGEAHYVGSHSAHYYADPGTSVTFSWTQYSGSTSSGTATISGRLVPYP